MSRIHHLLISLPALSHMLTEPPDLVIMPFAEMGYSDAGCYSGELKTPVITTRKIMKRAHSTWP